jgi:hypothetical protein
MVIGGIIHVEDKSHIPVFARVKRFINIIGWNNLNQKSADGYLIAGDDRFGLPGQVAADSGGGNDYGLRLSDSGN